MPAPPVAGGGDPVTFFNALGGIDAGDSWPLAGRSRAEIERVLHTVAVGRPRSESGDRTQAGKGSRKKAGSR